MSDRAEYRKYWVSEMFTKNYKIIPTNKFIYLSLSNKSLYTFDKLNIELLKSILQINKLGYISTYKSNLKLIKLEFKSIFVQTKLKNIIEIKLNIEFWIGISGFGCLGAIKEAWALCYRCIFTS